MKTILPVADVADVVLQVKGISERLLKCLAKHHKEFRIPSVNVFR
jgi:hypothetical protein